ncbi:hypothetical protein NKW85_12855 (plasmid) [Staphylococcus simulans]|uniref:hypothetical protein n=1 Tax=Staphylococcus simulans TaxID=1286 RepID=UPI000D1ECA13|nr:hypothetical protein [Staphylococcus simulans]PTJ33363.1 hypothetical protein BU024_13300 [Staphylococcus simulans]PTJ92199.1 hypothetical protein BU020_10820 [Staphylococcus simulans]RIN67356.1 hypothetical protein BU031_12365 [Staphylococcus simulans]
MFTLIVVIAIFVAIIYGINKLMDFIIYRSGGILEGGIVLFLGALRASQFVIGFGLLTGIVGSIPFLSFFWFIPFLITIYHLIHAFPLILGPFVAIASGFAGNELLGILPNFMINYYHKYLPINLYPLIGYNNREFDEAPGIFLVNEGWENEEFLDAVEKWANGEIDKKPNLLDYL